MPRDLVAITEIPSPGSKIANPAGGAINPTNGGECIGANDGRNPLLFRISNTAGGAKTVTIKKGESPPSLRAGIGDLTLSIPAGATEWFRVEVSRHLQKALSGEPGAVLLDYESGMTGTIAALHAGVSS